MHAVLLMIYLFCFSTAPTWKRYAINGTAQGTSYSIIYYAEDYVVTKASIDSTLSSLDFSLSLYEPRSLINQFNQSSKGVYLDEHMLRVLQQSIRTYHETNGLFDITVHPLVAAWGFGVNKNKSHLIPDSATIQSLRSCVGNQFIELNGRFLHKRIPCVQIDLNGIAQGYSVDVLALLLEQKGIKNYIVELGGELRVKGRKQPSDEKMRIGIEAPREATFDQQPFQKIITLDGGAITTSGNYRQYYESNGRIISHLIHPKTGYPQQNELISVTVYAKTALLADAYDNALLLMGLQEALSFIEKHKELGAYFIYRKREGGIADTATSAFLQLMIP